MTRYNMRPGRRAFTRRADRLIAAPAGMAHGHWFRTLSGSATDPCAYTDCRRPAGEHLRWVGEWAMPRRRRWRAMAARILPNLRRR